MGIEMVGYAGCWGVWYAFSPPFFFLPFDSVDVDVVDVDVVDT